MIRRLHHNATAAAARRDARVLRRLPRTGLPGRSRSRKRRAAARRTLHHLLRARQRLVPCVLRGAGCRSSSAQHDYDLHIGPRSGRQHAQQMLTKGKKAGVETRGVSDHGFIHSIYFRDPNGYVSSSPQRTPGARPRDGSGGPTARGKARAPGPPQAAQGGNTPPEPAAGASRRARGAVRSCGAPKSIAGPTGTMPLGLSMRWLS